MTRAILNSTRRFKIFFTLEHNPNTMKFVLANGNFLNRRVGRSIAHRAMFENRNLCYY